MQLSPHAWPVEQVLQHPSTGIVDQGTGGSGWRMTDAGSAGMRMPAIASAAKIRNMNAPLPRKGPTKYIRAPKSTHLCVEKEGKPLKTGRQIRNADFELFLKFAEDLFREAAAESDSERHEIRANRHGFGVSPQGRWGGIDKRLCDVFYGTRPFDNVTVFNSLDRPISRRTLSEFGGQLSYRRGDNGYVSLVLHGPQTDDRRPAEDGILILTRINPRKLLSVVVCGKHLRKLQAYYEVAGVDGDPNLRDRWTVFCLRNFRPTFLEQVLRPAKAYRIALRMAELSVTVGMSGSIWWLLTNWLHMAPK